MARTTKTKLVMDLLAENSKSANCNPLFPVKQREKKPLNIQKNRTDFPLPDVQHNPALRINTEASKTQYTWKYGDKQVLNIITMLINDELGVLLDRFNICDCEDCCKYITETAVSALPAVFVRAKCKADEQIVNAELAKYRSAVIKMLTKIAISLKNNPQHTDKRYGNL